MLRVLWCSPIASLFGLGFPAEIECLETGFLLVKLAGEKFIRDIMRDVPLFLRSRASSTNNLDDPTIQVVP
jgi:hypothetical protein